LKKFCRYTGVFSLDGFMVEMKNDDPIPVEETAGMCFVFYYSPHTTTVIHLVYDSYVARVPDNDRGFNSQCVKTA
jgi:hypothetical protein